MDPHSFIARAEAQRWLGIAEKLLMGHDLVGSKTFAIRARESDPRLEAAEQILAVADTLLAAEKRVVGSDGGQQPDFYAILQLVQFVQDTDHIANQYRRLAMLLNPHHNRFPYSDQAFQLVNEAWAVLSNPMRKSMYDAELDFPPPPQQMNTIGFNLEQQHHQQHQHHHQQQQQQHNFFSIPNHMGPGHEQELPEPPNYQTRVQQNHQHQQLQQHNFLSQSNPVRPVPVREQEQLFQIKSPQQLRSPPQPPQPQPPMQPPTPPPPAAPPQQPLSWQQTLPLSQPQQQQQVQPHSQLHQQLQQQQRHHQQEQQRQLEQQQEQQRQMEQQKLEQQRQIEQKLEQQRRIEQQKLEQQRQIERQKLEQQRQIELEQQRQIELEQQRQIEQQKLEQQRQIEQQKLEQQRQIEQQKLEQQQRQIEQQKLEQQQRKIEQQKLEQQRQIEQQKLEQQRQIEQQKLEQQRQIEQQKLEQQQKLEHQLQREQQRLLEQQNHQQQSLEQNAAPVQSPTQFDNGVQEGTERRVPDMADLVDQSPTFWTACPYCYYMYEYPRVYAECTLRCDHCKRAFQAVAVQSPPPIIDGKEAYFCCWGFFPLGVKMSHLEKNKGTSWAPFSPLYEASNNVQDHLNGRAAPKKNFYGNKSSGPRFYIDDVTDDVFLGVSEPSEDSDVEWGSTKRARKVKRAKGLQKGWAYKTAPGVKRQKGLAYKRAPQVLAVRARDATIGSHNNVLDGGLVLEDVEAPAVPVAEASKKSMGSNPRRQSGRVAKELGKLDLNVEFNNNDGEEPVPGMTSGNRGGQGHGEEDNIEGIGFFEGLDEFLSSLPILSVVNDEKVKAA